MTNHLFQATQNRYGNDLAAINMQRGRDHGLPSYNAFRQYCGLKRARNWNDLSGVFSNQTLQRYRQIYAHPDDIDFWSAGISERHVSGSIVGPVFGCILGQTFRNLRRGDRFWYENDGHPSSFSLGMTLKKKLLLVIVYYCGNSRYFVAQVNEIRKVTYARIICDNSDRLQTVQSRVMVIRNHNRY